MDDNKDNIKQQFFHSLKHGTGQAYLILLDNPNIDFSNLIIKGAIKNMPMISKVKEVGLIIFIVLLRR